jgi:hypothetical protein
MFSPSGSRERQTLRKLPKARPRRPAKMQPRINRVSSGGALAGKRIWFMDSR